ncbi:hypothetical protein [Ornithinimicrobium kibberense]|uniref:Uncharacterized protein n=1 Tax=Ornithinimicrobium kibberense TaxID=282060 RepID=A0ABV5V6N1_9MICO|nr:hypothetical protein [Ornithinimicrobium kibberense]
MSRIAQTAAVAAAFVMSGQAAQAGVYTAGENEVVGIGLDLVMTADGCQVQLTYDGPAELSMTAWTGVEEGGTYGAVAHLYINSGHYFGFASQQSIRENDGWGAGEVISPTNITAFGSGLSCEWPDEGTVGVIPPHAGVQGPPPHAGVPGPPPHARGLAVGLG